MEGESVKKAAFSAGKEMKTRLGNNRFLDLLFFW